ncbi:MAG: thioredoxin-dependent thiol peroxidase [Anaerolineales bacterium]
MTQLKAGEMAPTFVLNDENGIPHALEDYRGKALVLYFYPKDDTSGCTTEACAFRDDYSAYQENKVTIVGVSADDEKSHTKFKEKYSLPFTLLADTDKKVVKLYGVWGKKKMYGREYDGIYRTTFLIDAKGKIAKVFENVKPSAHSEEVLEAVAALQR